MPQRSNSREEILDSAETVVLRSGAVHLTLDAVAQQAGISKGGLLYNFPTKESLLQAMIARVVERCATAEADVLTRFEAGKAPRLKAYVDAALSDAARIKAISAALLAAGANDPKLLEPVRDFYRHRMAQLKKESGNPERAAAVMLAADGLWLLELLQIAPLEQAHRARVVAELMELAEEAERRPATGKRERKREH